MSALHLLVWNGCLIRYQVSPTYFLIAFFFVALVSNCGMQGVMDNHQDIVDYFNRRGVSAIFLFRRNLLRRMVSVLANLHDRDSKLINGTHMSHVHSKDEVVHILSSSFITLVLNPSLVLRRKGIGWCLFTTTITWQASILAQHKPAIDTRALIPELKKTEEMVAAALNYFNSTRHTILFYEDIITDQTVSQMPSIPIINIIDFCVVNDTHHLCFHCAKIFRN